ncbi:MAG: neutral/alkaline non-lysosomal ceramidase N-terminal domain-containing protein [Cyclobacteriaceae bacterium]
MRKALRLLIIVLLLLAVIALAFIRPLDQQPYREKIYYQKTLAALDSLKENLSAVEGDTIRAGWSQCNITPAQKLHLMGYGWKGDYESVHDSLMLRCFVFDDGRQKVALLSYDLMIVHPDLSAAIRQAADSAKLEVDGLYFTAVHTHKGYGEWARGLGGWLTAGGYNPELVSFVVKQTLAAIREADKSRQKIQIGYAAFSQPDLLRNRLTKGPADDDLLRVLKLEKEDGQTALLCTFAAHATMINSRSMQLSADYPSSLVKVLEAHPEVDFAAYAAGAVGSHSPYREGDFSYQQMDEYATRLASPLLDSLNNIRTSYSQKLIYTSLPLHLGEAQLKIAESWRVSPWLFEAFFGKLQPQLSGLRLGDVVLMGVPADYSGMLYGDLDAHDLPLMVTSFNGNYIGYIIPDEYYNLPHREARELNWFGPYTGNYVTEMMNLLLAVLAKKA